MIEHMVEQQHRLFLCRPNGEIIVQLNGVRTDSVEYNVQVKDYNQITFTVDKYIIVDGQLVKSNGYDDLEIYMNVLLDGLDMFQIQQPVIENDGTKETKVITGYSREKEFEDKDWTGLKVNTGEKDSLEYLIEDNINEYGFSINPIVLYDAQDTRFSLIHYILSKMPSWSVDTNDVDPLVRRTKIQINEDNINLYALLTSVIGPKAECLFLFDTLNRKIKVVSKQSLDEWYRDTGIYISFRNLANSVKVEVDEDSVFTVFTCRGEEDLDIRTVNYNDDKIYDLSYFMGQPWMDESLVNKIKLWEQWRELNREDFIVLTKDRATLNDEIYELNYQVPNDADFYTQWDNMEDELLLKNLAMYQANLDAMRASVDENPQYDADGNYIPWKKDGKIDDERYLELLLDNKAGYYTYIEITTYIIPNIEIAIRNKGKKEDEKEKYIREYETNWDLYGIIELEAKEESYVQQLDTLKDQYAKDWDDLTPEEKQKWTTQETYNIYHNRYVKFIEWLGTPTTEGTLRYRLAALKKTRAEKEARLAEIDSAIADYANLADITNELWGLTSDEIDTFFTLCHHTDYTNTNILTTSSDTTLTTVDVAKTLLEDSVGKLSEVSQPQMKFSVELDNFLDIPEFENWKDSFKLLNFIRVGIRDDYFVKLRLVGYKTNPCEIDPMIDVEFSNFITSRSGRSDLTELLDTENNRGSKNSISIGTGNSKDDREYVTTLLQIMTKSGLFQSAVGGVATGVITVGAVNAGEAVIGSLTVDEAYIRSLVADEISATTITTDQLFVKEGWFQSIYATYVTTEYLAAQMADIDILNTQSLTADSAFITSLQTMNSTAITSTVNDEFVTNLIAGKISVADLAAGDITLSNNMRIVSENGNLIMNGTALQIIGKDSDNQDYVGVQLGYDTSGNPSLILRNEDGATVLTPQGITEDAVADQLINNDMLKDNSISEEKLSFQVTKTTDSITLERIQHDGTSFYTEYTTFRNNYNTYTTNTNTTLTSLQNQINNIEVGAPNGIFGARQQYYLSDSSTALVPAINPPTYDWTDGDPADIPAGKYVWTRFVFTLDDGTEVFGSPMLNTTTTSLINRIDSKTGEIMSLITQTDIDVALFNNTIIGTIRDRVVSTEQDVDGITTRISDVESTVNGDSTHPSLSSRLNTVEDTASSHTQSISEINTAVNNLTNNQTTFTQTSTDFNFFVSRSGTGTPSSSNLSITADGATLIGGSLTIKDANNNATVISGGKITTNNISNTAGTSWINLGLGTFNYGDKLIWNGSTLTVEGNITANSGYIAAWEITPTMIRKFTQPDSNGVSYRVSLNSGTTITNTDTAAFVVEKLVNDTHDSYPAIIRYNGGVYFTKGTIGGLTIESRRIFSDSDPTDGYIAEMRQYDFNSNHYAFIVTDRTGSSNTIPFSVKYDGSVVMTKANVTGTVTANDGKIGGWTITSTAISKTSQADNDGVTYLARLSAPTTIATPSSNAAFLIAKYTNGELDEYPVAIYYDGRVSMKNATISGVINATSGSIGGWTAQSNRLYSQSASTGGYIAELRQYGYNENNYAFIITDRTGNSPTNPFRLKYDGTVVMTKATVTGTINANDGSIGNWTIGQTAIYNGMTSLGDTTHDGAWLGTNGIALGKGNFKVTNTGVLTAKSGTIGGWSIGANNIMSITTADNDGVSYRVVLNTGSISPTQGAIYVRKYVNNEADTIPFIVRYNGSVRMTNADITGTITATGGTIGGFTTTSKRLYSQSADTGGYIAELRQYGYNENNYAFIVTDRTGSSSSVPFGVKYDGSVIMTKATVTGTVTATNGNIGGWTVSGGSLFKKSTPSGGVYYKVAMNAPSSLTTANVSNVAAFVVGEYNESDDSVSDYKTLIMYDGTVKTGWIEIDGGTIGSVVGKKWTIDDFGFSFYGTSADKDAHISTEYIQSPEFRGVQYRTYNSNILISDSGISLFNTDSDSSPYGSTAGFLRTGNISQYVGMYYDRQGGNTETVIMYDPDNVGGAETRIGGKVNYLSLTYLTQAEINALF